MTTNRVIFLDYDGVLNDPQYLSKLKPDHKTYEELDPKRLSLLKTLCTETKAKVVLTSTWRDDIETRKWIRTHYSIPVLGATPHRGDNRGMEIHQWIVDSKFNGQYIIIDDEDADLNETQKQHLVYTREGHTLGLERKHITFAKALFQSFSITQWADADFITAILESIEADLLRVMWNINQEEYDNDNPFRNTGNVKGYKNDTFEVHAYDWGWDLSDSNTPQPPNFIWRDLEITWYKHCGRGISTNRPVTHDELAIMLKECRNSLDEIDIKNRGY